MPNNRNRVGTVYVVTGNPDTVNENFSPTLLTVGYAEGELGTDYSSNNKRYQIVRLDPGSVPTLPNQLAFWSDKTQYIVTNVTGLAVGGTTGYQNNVAGRFGSVPITPGNRCHIQQRGPATLIAPSGTFAAGTTVIASATTAGAADAVAIGTAPGFQAIGQATGPAAAGVVPVFLDIPAIE